MIYKKKLHFRCAIQGAIRKVSTPQGEIGIALLAPREEKGFGFRGDCLKGMQGGSPCRGSNGAGSPFASVRCGSSAHGLPMHKQWLIDINVRSQGYIFCAISSRYAARPAPSHSPKTTRQHKASAGDHGVVRQHPAHQSIDRSTRSGLPPVQYQNRWRGPVM